jgi:hypothetical protein
MASVCTNICNRLDPLSHFRSASGFVFFLLSSTSLILAKPFFCLLSQVCYLFGFVFCHLAPGRLPGRPLLPSFTGLLHVKLSFAFSHRSATGLAFLCLLSQVCYWLGLFAFFHRSATYLSGLLSQVCYLFGLLFLPSSSGLLPIIPPFVFFSRSATSKAFFYIFLKVCYQ